MATLDVEIDRYARLIESLRRLPPELRDLEVVPDSLAYHNDSLDVHLMRNESLLQQELQEQVDAIIALNEQLALEDPDNLGEVTLEQEQQALSEVKETIEAKEKGTTPAFILR